MIQPHERAMLNCIDGDALVRRATAWADINSGSGNLAGLARMADALCDAASGLPGVLQRIPLPPVTQITATGATRETAQGDALRLVVRPEAPRQVALTGHYDTVFDADSQFQSTTVLPDGRLNGPGLADMKGGISVMLGALEAFEQLPGSSGLGYTVLLSPDEETGSLASAPLLAALACNAAVGLTYEPALADGTLVSARKGSGNYDVVISGRSAHAGRDFASGRNAIVAAAHMAIALDSLNGQRDGVTVNVARIDGGGPSNIIPDKAVVRFNLRIPDDAARQWAEEAIRTILGSRVPEGIALSLHGGISRPPKPFTTAQQKLFASMKEIGALLGQEIGWAPSGGVCEGNNLLAAGLPNIDTLGVRGGAIHSHAEFACPESFAERAQLSALWLARFADGTTHRPDTKLR